MIANLSLALSRVSSNVDVQTSTTNYSYQRASCDDSLDNIDFNKGSADLLCSNFLQNGMLGDPIGSGTYGDVYKVRSFVNGRSENLAVKVIRIESADDLQSIEQEIKILNSIEHDNIVKYYDSCYRQGRLWITMEYCSGGSLQDVYHSIGSLRENEIAFACREVLKGLCYLHARKKIHRDVKGANVLLTDYGAIKLADFGVSAEISATISKRKSFIGTPYWMAPEVAAVERKGGYDHQCDVWAVGITSIELAELQPPLYDLHPMRALFLMSRSNYKAPSLTHKDKWSTQFNGFVKSSLTKSPKKRPTSSQLLKHEFVSRSDIAGNIGLELYRRSMNTKAGKTLYNKMENSLDSKTLVNGSSDICSARQSISTSSDIDSTLLVGSCSDVLNANSTVCTTLIAHRNLDKTHQPNATSLMDTADLYSRTLTSSDRSSSGGTSFFENSDFKTSCFPRKDLDSWLECRIRELFPGDNVSSILKICHDRLPSGCLDHLSEFEASHIISVIVREMAENDSNEKSIEINEKLFNNSVMCRPHLSTIVDQSSSGKLAYDIASSTDPMSFPVSYLNGTGRPPFKHGKSTSAGPMPGLPPVPKIHMGACFTKIFNNCPYTVNTAINWISPQNSGNLIFIGCDEGIFSLDLLALHDSCLRKISNKRTTWLYERDNVLWTLSGRKTTFIYHHELTHDLTDTSNKSNMDGFRPSIDNSLVDLSRPKKLQLLHSGFDKVFHHKYNKLLNSRGTQLCTVAQCPYSKFIFMISLSPSKLCMRQYYAPTKQFLLLKIFKVEFENTPSVFRPLIFRDFTYPLLCMAVVKSELSDAPAGLVLADLNEDEQLNDAISSKAEHSKEHHLNAVDIVQLQDDKKLAVAYKECVYIAHFDKYHKQYVKLVFLLFRLPDPLTRIIALPDSVLTFHCHGMIGKNLKDGQITQDISDVTKCFQVLNDHGSLIIMKSQLDECSRNCDLLILMGHKNSL